MREKTDWSEVVGMACFAALMLIIAALIVGGTVAAVVNAK